MKKLQGLLIGICLLVGLSQSAFAQDASLYIKPDASGQFSSQIRPPAAYIDARVVLAGVSETHTMPSGYRRAIFSATCDFYAKPGASAAVPGADVTAGTASELNPAAWDIDGITQITFVSSVDCVIIMSLYKR